MLAGTCLLLCFEWGEIFHGQTIFLVHATTVRAVGTQTLSVLFAGFKSGPCEGGSLTEGGRLKRTARKTCISWQLPVPHVITGGVVQKIVCVKFTQLLLLCPLQHLFISRASF